MTIYSGNDFILRIEVDGKFEVIEGIYDSKFSLNHQFTKSNSISNSSLQQIHKSKVSNLNLDINGIYTGSIAEEKIRYLAFIGNKGKYQLSFGMNQKITSNLVVTKYERIGNQGSEERYNISFESSGEILVNE